MIVVDLKNSRPSIREHAQLSVVDRAAFFLMRELGFTKRRSRTLICRFFGVSGADYYTRYEDPHRAEW